MLTIHLLTTPDTTLSWLFYLLLGLLLVTILAGALIGRKAMGRRGSSMQRSAKKAARTARKATPEKKLAK